MPAPPADAAPGPSSPRSPHAVASRVPLRTPGRAQWGAVETAATETTRAGLGGGTPRERTPAQHGPAWLRRGLLATIVVALAVTLSGCLQLSSDLSVRKNDTVSGRILLAGNNPAEAESLSAVSVPSGLEEKVRVSNYAANAFVGKEVYFTDLTFADVDNLVIGMQPDQSHPYSLSFSRSGGKVTFSGSVDLTSIPGDQAQAMNARIDLSFPARIESTNGTVGDDDTRVSWTPKAGTVTTMNASTSYPDPATRGFAVWLIVGIGAAILVSILVVLLARSSRAKADAAGL